MMHVVGAEYEGVPVRVAGWIIARGGAAIACLGAYVLPPTNNSGMRLNHNFDDPYSTLPPGLDFQMSAVHSQVL